ncbi:MAG: DUF4390 domain-containing protein [Candidatus Latescibacterota bacterium]
MVLFKRMITIACCLLMPPGQGSAQARDSAVSPSILAVHLYIARNTLAGDVKSTGLFSDRIASTIQSGLPAVVEFFYSVETPGRGAIERGVLTYQLTYDVWDDYYSIESADTIRTYSTYHAMTQAIQHLRQVALLPLHKMETDGEYSVRLGVAINPLRGSDRKKITGWVDDTVRGASSESWREQVLNLNDLIQHFFTKRKNSNQSELFQTEFFRPGTLLLHDRKGE